MPTKGQIVRAGNSKVYSLEERLGGGAIATVWSGVGV